jgi:hypothetical protein
MATANNPKCAKCGDNHWTEECSSSTACTTDTPANTAKATSFKLELARVAEHIEVRCHKFLPSYLGACHAHELTAKRGDEALAKALQHAFVTLAPASYDKPIIMNYRQARELALSLRTIAKTLGDTIEFGEDCPISITETCEELYWAIADAVLAEPVPTPPTDTLPVGVYRRDDKNLYKRVDVDGNEVGAVIWPDGQLIVRRFSADVWNAMPTFDPSLQ